jgi:ABC-type uncharacterized transport system permease subunit
MRSGRIERFLLVLVAPVIAILFAGVLVTVILSLSGASPAAVIPEVLAFGTTPQSLVNVANKATTYYMAGLAAAVGFRMLLFNIGIDGQYRLGVFVAAVVGASVTLPKVLHIGLIVLVAMTVGALWAGIAGYLKVRRGVSEVISTIMLNAIATGLIAYMLNPNRLAERVQGSNNIRTPLIPESGWLPSFNVAGQEMFGFVPIAILLGIGYSVLLNRTRFGFELRASGMSQRAALVSGVDSRRMILVTMLMSGAIAGLAGVPQLLGSSYRFGLDFPAGYGFTGLAIALLGRNHPVGVAFGSLLWAWLERSAQMFDLLGVSREIITIMQATIVLTVVVAYEFTRRINVRRQQRLVGRLEQEAGA